MSSPNKIDSRPAFSASNYIRIARPDHWIKNIFMLPGAAVAWPLASYHSMHMVWLLVLGLVSLCFTASANYSINEYLDAQHDRHHPLKSNRPAARGLLDGRLVLLEYLALLGIGCGLAAEINVPFLATTGLLLVMGIIYNVPPVRTKDMVYLDVLSESVNNPIRFLLGWFVITDYQAPPVSVLIAYWMGGAFLMGVKRFSEYRRIGNPAQAARYRRSFAGYTENSLLLSAFFYAISSAFFLAVFLIKYRVELILSFPLFSALFTWYLAIGLKEKSAAQAPEKLYREATFLGFAALVFVAALLLTMVHLPFLGWMMQPHLIHFNVPILR